MIFTPVPAAFSNPHPRYGQGAFTCFTSLSALTQSAIFLLWGCRKLFYGNNRQPSALHANGGGDDTGGIGAFLSCIGLALWGQVLPVTRVTSPFSRVTVSAQPKGPVNTDEFTRFHSLHPLSTWMVMVSGAWTDRRSDFL